MRFVQLLWLPMAFSVGVAVYQTGWLAAYCEPWTQIAGPSLFLLAVAAQISQMGVRRDLYRIKRKWPGDPDISSGRHIAEIDQTLNNYLAHRYSPGIFSAIAGWLGTLTANSRTSPTRSNFFCAGFCSLWSFTGFVIPVLLTTVALVGLTAAGLIPKADWWQSLVVWGVTAVCAPLVIRLFPGDRDENIWETWRKSGLITAAQQQAILKNRNCFNTGHGIFTARDQSSWQLRTEKQERYEKCGSVRIGRVYQHLQFADYTTFMACCFFPGVHVNYFLVDDRQVRPAVKLNVDPLASDHSVKLAEPAIQKAAFVILKGWPCHAKFYHRPAIPEPEQVEEQSAVKSRKKRKTAEAHKPAESPRSTPPNTDDNNPYAASQQHGG
jgi:hypothetical protein